VTISYIPAFQHQPWIDNVDRVSAGGPNGVNRRFDDLRAEFDTLANVIKQINDALVALGQKPPPQDVKITLTPNLVPVGGSQVGWNHRAGLAEKPAGQTSAHGMMSVEFPNGARIRGLRVSGRNAGAGSLRVALRRQGVTADASAADQIARVDATGDPFDLNVTVPDGSFPPVDTANFKFFLVADLDNAQATDAVVLTVFQITVTVG
jgi:hypothetical protein